MVEFLSANWVWILLIGTAFWMMLGHGGHGGRGGCGGGHHQPGSRDGSHEHSQDQDAREYPQYPDRPTGGSGDPAAHHHERD